MTVDAITKKVNTMSCCVCGNKMRLRKRDALNAYLIKTTLHPVHKMCMKVMPFKVWIKKRPDKKRPDKRVN